MKKTIIIFIAGMAAFAASCTKYLDMTPTDRVSDKVLWSTTETAEYHVNALYTYLYSVLMNQSSAGLTEAFTDQLKYGSYTYSANCYIPSEIAYGDPTIIKASFVDVYLGNWGAMYQYIAKVNNAIYCLKKYGQMSDEDKVRLEAELKFIRGYLYFDLMKRYKEIIIYDENMDAYTKDKALSTEEQGWDFVLNDFKFAAERLPAREAAAGRLNKGAAYGFITRSMLYAERWQEVYDAAVKVEELGYALIKSGAETQKAYIADYKASYSTAGNNEAILQYLFDRGNNITHSFDFYYTPGGDFTYYGESGGGYGTPTQEMVESYEKADGGKVNWSTWHHTTNSNPPYEELEPRFHATILYNGADWKGRKIETFVNGRDGFCAWNIEPEPKGRSTTGYYLRKIVDENHDVIANRNSVQPLTIMRYAEVLLNKAEACYQLRNKDAEANALLRNLRARVGLPYTDQAGTGLMEAIRQERKVELSYEGLWYWDLRRWGVAHLPYPEGLTGYQQHGLKITLTGTDSAGEPIYQYQYVSVDDEDRNFSQLMYRFPLPEGELANNGAVDQYKEWR